METPSKKPLRTKERYILDSLLSVFQGGHWVDDVPVQEILEEPENGSQDVTEAYLTSSYLTVIGGQKYDKQAVAEHLAYFLEPEVIIVGGGRGVESDLLANEHMETIHVQVDPDRFGKNARKVNVEQVLSFAPTSPLLLVGNGERVKQARAWLKRANWGREVIELP